MENITTTASAFVNATEEEMETTFANETTQDPMEITTTYQDINQTIDQMIYCNNTTIYKNCSALDNSSSDNINNDIILGCLIVMALFFGVFLGCLTNLCGGRIKRRSSKKKPVIMPAIGVSYKSSIDDDDDDNGIVV